MSGKHGSKVEFVEKLIDAAKRKLKEETNLQATKLELLCISNDMTLLIMLQLGLLFNSIKEK